METGERKWKHKWIMVAVVSSLLMAGPGTAVGTSAGDPSGEHAREVEAVWDASEGVFEVTLDLDFMMPPGSMEAQQDDVDADSYGQREFYCGGFAPVKRTCGGTIYNIQSPLTLRINANPMVGDVYQTISTTTGIFAWRCEFVTAGYSVVSPDCSVLTANGWFFVGQTMTMSGAAPAPAVGSWRTYVYTG